MGTGIGGNRAYQRDHVSGRAGASPYPLLEFIDAIDVDAVKAGIENAVEICVGASEQDLLPPRAPILHAVIALPVQVSRLEPFPPVCQPAALPLIAVLLRLA